MSKQHAHSLWAKIRPLSPWYILALALVFGTISVLAMRQNNLTMVKLRGNVFTADKAGGDVETALRNLRGFIYSHMNTNLDSSNSIKPPIQLKYSYDRLAKKEQQRVKAANAVVYSKAEQACQQFFVGGRAGPASAPCIRSYVNSHLVKEQPISDALYKFDFVSPTWTPDLAGWSLLAAAVLALVFAMRLGLEFWVKHDLHNRL